MVPKKVYTFFGSMPRTSSGKIDRPTVIKQCLEGTIPNQQSNQQVKA